MSGNGHTAVVIGGGLAGCEAAYALASFGVRVTLYEMKPVRFSSAHHSENLAELVCSNSFKASRLGSAAGLLKEEMRLLGSVCLRVADQCTVPAGGALSVDRERFSQGVTKVIASHPRITVVREEGTEVPPNGVVVFATGPLTSDALTDALSPLVGDRLFFYDAAAPIVTGESVDLTKAFFASRYYREEGENTGQNRGDYLNCPLNKAEYEAFWVELVNAERAPLHDFDRQSSAVYEGCMPVEVLASRGKDAIRYGPMKPVGLRDPATGHRPWAVLQLRSEDAFGTLRNLVGFQTNLTFSEQRRVFGMIPALKNAEFVRYGVTHRNTYIHSPSLLNASFQLKSEDRLFFAGQITGVEGYMESAASGILAGINAAAFLLGEPCFIPPENTMTGALCRYISAYGGHDFQPMGANFGLLPPLDSPPRDKKSRYDALGRRGVSSMTEAIAAHPLFRIASFH